MSCRPANVFIVDDSRVIQCLLEDMLSELPSARLVGKAETADEAIAGILQSHPDCVFLDLNLRQGTGLSVLQAVHPQAPEIVFVVMTNNEGERYRQACMAAGADHFLDKTNELGKLRYTLDCLDLK
ncbi:response regulator [Chitinimonas sp.]|uniref:response regulator n=1 Tax=Chitinimonas sp. TaxID=1934313 RepID=UPI002F952301